MNRSLLFTFLFQFLVLFLSAQNCSVSIIKFQPSGTCEETTIQLVASPITPGAAYQWNCPNPVYNSTTGPFLYIPKSSMLDRGNYTLTVTDSSGCLASANDSVFVFPKPIVSISGQGFACLGTKTSLYANDVCGNYSPYTYSWDNNATTKSIKILHNGGTYPHPSCVITNSNGCSASNQTSYMIGTIYPPFSEITYTGLTAFCSPGSVELKGPQGPQYAYQWRRSGNNISGAHNASFKAAVTGNYKLILSDINGCSDTSGVVAVTVYPKPAAAITPTGPTSFCTGDSVILVANAGTGYSYQWKKNGNVIAGANNIAYTAKKAGNYSVIVTSNFDCIKTSSGQSVSTGCREEEMLVLHADPLRVSAFPNPSSGNFTLQVITGNTEKVSMDLFDMLGNKVLSAQDISAGGDITFGKDLTCGIYSARISQAGLIRVVRLVKTR